MIKTTIEKQLNILDFALSSLWRHKLKNASVMLVFAVVIFLLSSFQMVTLGLTQAASQALSTTPEITIQRMSAGRQEAIPLDYTAKLSSLFGIRKVLPRVWGYYFDETRLANYTVMGIDMSAMPGIDKLQAALSAGSLPTIDEAGGVVVGQAIKKTMGLQPQQRFSLFRPDLSLKPLLVTGIFRDETDLLTGDILAMNIKDARDLFGIAPDMATDLCVYVSNPTEVTTIAKKISTLLPDTRVLTRPQIQKTYQVVFGWRSGFGSVCLLTALVAFTILAWDKASGLSPEERREIGILKILGWETTDILTIRFWESCLVSAIAFVSGCTFAFIHVSFFNAILLRPVMVGWSVLAPPFKLLPAVSFADFLLIFSLSVMPYLAVTVIPAWRCAIVPADSAIR